MSPIPHPGQSSAPPASEQGLHIEVDRSNAGPRRVRVRGELDIATAPLLARELDRAADGRSQVEVDLRDLAFCDVVGLTAIEQAQHRLASRHCRLTLDGTGPVRLLLGVPGLFDIAWLDGASVAGRHPAP